MNGNRERLIIIATMLLFTAFVFVLFGDTCNIIPYWLASLLIGSFIYRKEKGDYALFLFSFIYYTFWGVLAYSSYFKAFGSTFAPYCDDSLYFYNIKTIWTGFEKNPIMPYSLFEILYGLVTYPIAAVVKVLHYQLLPFNWMMGGIVVVEAVKLANSICPNGKQSKWLPAAFILLNANFTNGTVHLYRDVLVCLLSLLAMKGVIEGKYAKSAVYSVGTAFVRGANGFLMGAYLLIDKLLDTFKPSKKMVWVLFVAIISISLLGISKIDLSKMGRITSKASKANYLETRLNNWYGKTETGGVMNLLRSHNPLVKSLALPVYFVSPVKVANLQIKESTSALKQRAVGTRVRVETLWEFMHIVFYSFSIVFLFYGIWCWASTCDMKSFALFILFVLSICLITFVSMQTRHKMFFIILIPIAVNYGIACSSAEIRKSLMLAGIGVSILILIYNLF